MAKSVYAIAAALLTASCAVGPKYTKPSAPTPPAYKETGEGPWKPAQPSDDLARGKWWERFNDSQLNALEEKVAISNQSVLAAIANLQASRAMIREARAQYFPTLTANPSIANSRISTAYGQTVGVGYSLYSVPLQASWEPDLFGRVRNTVQSSKFAAQASAADLENVRLSAQANVAADYYELRAQDAMKQVLESTAAAYRESLELNRVLYRSGLGADEAVAQAESQLKIVDAQEVALGVLRAQYEHAIAVLDGEPPAALSISAEAPKSVVPSIPVGVPSQLLERRPDIAAAERAVAQANAQIGIAQSAYFPAVTLSAAFGLESLTPGSLFTWPSRVWSVGPSLAETIFDAGLRKATVAQYQAAYDQTVANYRQTVLTAFQQVEDNLAALRILAQAVERQGSAIESAQRNLEEEEVRYRAGLDPYLDVIAAQAALLNDEQAQVTFREQQMVASVQLIEALGGGWDTSKL